MKRIFLKPCPICGSAPSQHSETCEPWGRGDGYATFISYKCTGCGYIQSHGIMVNGDYHEATEKAQVQWNENVAEIETMIEERYKELYK